MKHSSAAKSSFTLPSAEIPLVRQLKRSLRLKSNTAVIRIALHELKKKLSRNSLREEFARASRLVREANRKDMSELDQLSDEGLI